MSETKTLFSTTKISLVLVLLTILTILSIPIYGHYKIFENRKRAEASLEHLASRMGEFYSLQGTYKKVTPEVLSMQEIDMNPGYQLKIIRNLNEHFTVSAIPVGFQKRKDPKCGTLSITDSGKKYITGTGTVAACFSN